MMKGVISFVVASVFLLVLVSSAAKLPGRAPDYSYQPVVAAHVEREAVQQAFSDALSEAAKKSLAASGAAEAPAAVKGALYLAAMDFEARMRESGQDALFWCGETTEGARQEASWAMAGEGHSVLPEGALPLTDPACAGSFDVNLLRMEARVSNAGFSQYLPGLGIGYAAGLPENYGVDIGG